MRHLSAFVTACPLIPAPVPRTPHALPVQVAELLRGIGLADVREWVPVWDGAVHAHVAARTPAGRPLAFSLTEPAMYTNPAASGGLLRPLGSLRTAMQLLEAAAFRVRPPRSAQLGVAAPHGPAAVPNVAFV